MTRGRQSPFWNQDLVLAIGLAIAGIMMLESKLFATLTLANTPVLNRLLDWKLIAWWPVLLIIGGVVLWIAKARSNRARHGAQHPAQLGGK